MQKLGMKPVGGVSRVMIRKSKNVSQRAAGAPAPCGELRGSSVEGEGAAT